MRLAYEGTIATLATTLWGWPGFAGAVLGMWTFNYLWLYVVVPWVMGDNYHAD